MFYFRYKKKLSFYELIFVLPAFFSLSCSILQNQGNVQFKEHAIQREKKELGVLRKDPLKSFSSSQEELDLFPSSKNLDKDLYLRNQSDYHYSLGEVYSFEGNSRRAIEEFKLTLLYDPNSLSVHLRLSAEYLKQGLLIEALEQAERAVKKHPKSVDARLLLGNLYTSMMMYKEALAQYHHVKAIDPKNQEVSFQIVLLFMMQEKYISAEKELSQWIQHPSNREKARSYYLMSRLCLEYAQVIALERDSKKMRGLEVFYRNKAKNALSKALSIQPYFLSATVFLAEIHLIEKSIHPAILILSSFQERFGFHRETAHLLSQIYIDKKDYLKAREQLSYLEEIEPKNANYKLQIALIDIELKKYNLAIQRLHEILRDYESDKVQYYLGAIYEKIERNESALFHFSRISKESDYYPEALLREASLYKKLGHIEKAKYKIYRALSLDLDRQWPAFYFFYASLLYEEEDKRGALNVLEKGVEIFSKNSQLIFYLGSLYVEVGEKEKGIQKIKEMMKIEKDHLQAMNLLAYTYADLNQHLDVAEKLARKVLKKKPKDGYFLDTLGWVLYKRGKTKEAIRYLEDAYRRESGQSVIAEHLADAYYRLNLPGKAKIFYEKALNLEEDQSRALEIERKILALEP